MSVYDIFERILLDEDQPSAPPGSPIDRNDRLKNSNWFETQLALALFIGISSFLIFCSARIRFPATFSTRTYLRHQTNSLGFFSWILPTLRTPDSTILNNNGLDALVLLYFFKLGFYFFLTIAILAFLILVPINVHENGTTEGVPADPTPPSQNFLHHDKSVQLRLVVPIKTLTQHLTLYHISHLAFTYIFSLILLRFLQHTYFKLINIKPRVGLSNSSSSLRTVLIEKLPAHLRNDQALTDYFDQVIDYPVQSAHVLKDVTSLLPLLQSRTSALKQLQRGYQIYQQKSSEPFDSSALATQSRFRPRYRPSWFSLKTVDWIDHWKSAFDEADRLVQQRRKGKFKTLSFAFVTFKNLDHAQILCQTIHWPRPDQALISLAPDSRNIQWSNIAISSTWLRLRQTVVWILMALLYGFWATPISFLAKLMSYETLVSWLSPVVVELIERSNVVKALIQNSLPTLAIIIFNALLPTLLDCKIETFPNLTLTIRIVSNLLTCWIYLLIGLSTFQGFKSRSEIEYSLLRKYHLFLLVTVLFIFVAVSTFSLLRDLRDNPGGLIDKLATSLPGARNFFISYLTLQSLAILPLQLLQLPTLALMPFYNYQNTLEVMSLGTIYPQALLAFNICMAYSVITPVILIFGCLYFGMAYLVYKYKIINIYCRPYESRGEAWPIACNRIGWGLIIFQVFMLGLLSLRQVFLLSTLVLPLIAYTIWRLFKLNQVYKKHLKFISLSQIRESSVAMEPNTDGSDQEGKHLVAIFIGIVDHDETRPYGHPAITGRLPMPEVPDEGVYQPIGE
ncbi:uncharacterized protein MELLADRAFT_90487 [Melampsora larici-populina 98AG31]|uniref:CSC1/OSCA1-like 7TM region domain-containing protein n=1 Tax=Melampsora larici-populina (strain 98AG31 / pathotype 3-4-7) TaxID=747676 RepID=F4RX30_MELLP|nr:uncharacterized protein MELLADRAFT_90487 [Melampsora larici-populina 98AG31]EGG02890.1 hypothetical protein MELLADRAFT_90487 [Melampsora larici-populina 98AG31]